MPHIPWWRLPTLLAVPKLINFRNDLRAKNLHDTEDEPLNVGIPPIEDVPLLRMTRDDRWHLQRSEIPENGRLPGEIRRNFELKECLPGKEKLLVPNPRTVSRELMTRDEFKPVPFLNLIRCIVDSVSGARLVRAWTRRVRPELVRVGILPATTRGHHAP
jgi:hypothetical protein